MRKPHPVRVVGVVEQVGAQRKLDRLVVAEQGVELLAEVTSDLADERPQPSSAVEDPPARVALVEHGLRERLAHVGDALEVGLEGLGAPWEPRRCRRQAGLEPVGHHERLTERGAPGLP
jgi:hypothetical protein